MKNMKNGAVLGVIAVAMMVGGTFFARESASPVLAQVSGSAYATPALTTSVSGTSALQEQIDTLLRLVRQLQEQLDRMRGEWIPGPSLIGIAPASGEVGSRVTISGRNIATGTVYLKGPNDGDFWSAGGLASIIGSTPGGGNSYIFTLPTMHTVGMGGSGCDDSGRCWVADPAIQQTLPGVYAVKVKVGSEWSNSLSFTVTAGPTITISNWSNNGTQTFTRGERYFLRWSTNTNISRFDIKAREIIPTVLPSFGSLHPYGPEMTIASNASGLSWMWEPSLGWMAGSYELRVCEAGTAFCSEWYGFSLTDPIMLEQFTLSLLTDKSSYKDGDQARLTVLVANTGREMLTVSNDGCVLDYSIKDVTTGETVYAEPETKICTQAIVQLAPGRTGIYTESHNFNLVRSGLPYANLTPGHTYAFRVGVLGRTAEALFTYTRDSTPQAPFGLTATAISTDSIRLAWQNVDGRHGFKVFEDGCADSPCYHEIYRTKKTTYTVTGLEPGSYHVYSISACADSACSRTSPPSRPAGEQTHRPNTPTLSTALPDPATPGQVVRLYGSDLRAGDRVVLSDDHDQSAVSGTRGTATLEKNATDYFTFRVPTTMISFCHVCSYIMAPQPEVIMPGGYYLWVESGAPLYIYSNVIKLMVGEAINI